MDPKIALFESSSIYQSWTFDPKKCVFDKFLGERRRYVFAKLTGPVISTDRGCLDCATQKVCPRRCCTVAKRPKIRRRRRRRRRMENGRTFLSVAHTKCPSGKNTNQQWESDNSIILYLITATATRYRCRRMNFIFLS